MKYQTIINIFFTALSSIKKYLQLENKDTPSKKNIIFLINLDIILKKTSFIILFEINNIFLNIFFIYLNP